MDVKLDLSAFDLHVDMEEDEQVVDVVVIVRKVALNCGCESINWASQGTSMFMQLGMVEAVGSIMRSGLVPTRADEE